MTYQFFDTNKHIFADHRHHVFLNRWGFGGGVYVFAHIQFLTYPRLSHCHIINSKISLKNYFTKPVLEAGRAFATPFISMHLGAVLAENIFTCSTSAIYFC